MHLYNPNKNLDLWQIKVYVFTNIDTSVIWNKLSQVMNYAVLRFAFVAAFSRAFSHLRPGVPHDLAPKLAGALVYVQNQSWTARQACFIDFFF